MFLSFSDVLNDISNFIDEWINGNILSPIIMVLILLTGIILSFRLNFLQVSLFGHSINQTIVPAVKSIVKKPEKKAGKKSAISQFQAFSAAIAGTVGTGNIVGVSTAICLGGPGAIFWMWFSAFFGMLTNFCENVLGIYFRKKNEKGEYVGGAMYYITHGLGLKWLAIMFAIFCVFASLGYNMAQVNSISSTFVTIADNTEYVKYIVGGIVAVIVFMVIIGGIQRISKVASYIVPMMALIFVTFAVVIICMNITELGNAFGSIFSGAFSFQSFGSGLMGYGIMRAMRFGIARGIFSNEAGLGSSVMAHSASDVKEPVKQGLWGIFEVFLDTFVICSLMALVYLTSGAYDLYSAGELSKGAAMGLWAFEGNLGMFGKVLFTIILPLFAFTTVLSWEFYGEKAVEYLLGHKYVLPFKIIYVILVFCGAILSIDLVWNLSDTFNVLMAIPNLIALILLSGTLKAICGNYLRRRKGLILTPMVSAYPRENKRIIRAMVEEEGLQLTESQMSRAYHDDPLEEDNNFTSNDGAEAKEELQETMERVFSDEVQDAENYSDIKDEQDF